MSITVSKNSNCYSLDSPYGKINLFVTNNKKIDIKSLTPHINLKDEQINEIEWYDVDKLLIDNNKENLCRYFNYLIFEYLSDFK